MQNPRFLAVALSAALMLAAASGASVCAAQLSADGDADGVPDEHDACLYSPRGIVVGPNGCSTPGDEDEDQVADAVDACPLSPAGALVDAQGCALDEDLDGVADGVDRCMGSQARARVDARGCASGQVASTPLVRRARAPVAVTMAPVAPTQPPALPPAQVVAPPSTAAPPAPAAPQKPSPPAAVATQVTTKGPAETERTVFFDAGESDLGWSNSRAVKRSARELMPELERDPSTSLVVSGHGDIKFDGMSVPRVALARANTVRDALVAAGVPAQRITVRVPGINEPRFYGDEQPRNCRVELKLSGRAPTPPAAPVPVAPPPAPVAVAIATSTKAAAAPIASSPRVLPDPPPARTLPDPPPRPTSPATAPTAATPRALAKATIGFAPFSAVLDDDAIRVLNGFVQTGTRVMLADSASRVLIVSGIGPGEAGTTSAQRLAESRAASLSAYLVSLGLPHSRIGVSDQIQTGERRAELSVVSP